MNRDIAMKWVEDLRTPGLKQATAALFDGEGYCCLGRLCIVLGMQPFQHAPGVHTIGGNQCTLPDEAMDAAKIRSSNGRADGIEMGALKVKCLADANDGGATFAQIADWIEQHYRRL